jgi:glutamine amidotransferase
MKLAIIQYNAGNIQSVLFALQRLGVDAQVTEVAEEISSADRVIFPGVGEASSAMKYLKNKRLDRVIQNLKQPVLGICLGMQLLCRHSEENDTDCLGIIPLGVKRFVPGNDGGIKVPQVGWNSINNLRSELFENIAPGSHVYNVHSFYVPDSSYTIAETDYSIRYASAISNGNFYGVQFHAEKSGVIGETILGNFLKL